MMLRRMMKISCLVVSGVGLALIGATYAQNQHPILDLVANKVIQKYQTSSCEQLWAERANKQPPTPEKQNAIQLLRGDPQLRTVFINKVAGPIANKLFQCGMIP